MNEDLELALAYWRTMSPQPKAIVYANAIEARIKGIETKEMVIDHELKNAIERGAFIARARGIKPVPAKQPAIDKPKAKTKQTAKVKTDAKA
jgi:hypothetical protein